jgi:hypothetical protein
MPRLPGPQTEPDPKSVTDGLAYLSRRIERALAVPDPSSRADSLRQCQRDLDELRAELSAVTRWARRQALDAAVERAS